MTVIRMTVVGALLAALAGQASAQVEDRRQNTQRTRQEGYMNSFDNRTGIDASFNAGDRIVTLVSPAEGTSIDLWVDVSWDGGNSFFTIWGDYGAGTFTRKIDIRAPWTARYRTRITTGFSWGNFIFATDTTPSFADAANGPLANTCFGAIGPDCNFYPMPGGCWRSNTGTLSCNTSVGSQKHDTCCSQEPSGSMCNYVPTWGVCQPEWDIAQDDVLKNRTWLRSYDPTHVSYTDSFRVSNPPPVALNWANSAPVPGVSYLVPQGVKMRTTDFNLGFCSTGCSGSAGTGEVYCQTCSGGGGGSGGGTCGGAGKPPCHQN